MAIRSILLAGIIGLGACSPAAEDSVQGQRDDTAAEPASDLGIEATPEPAAELAQEPAQDAAAAPVSDDGEDAADAPGATLTVNITEWPVPWEGRPRDPYTIDGETVWFVGQVNSYLGRLDVASGEITRTELREGAGPHNLIVDEAGIVWYAGNRDHHIGRFDPASGEFEYVETPEDTARDPHTLIFDAAGDIWFTSQQANAVGHLILEGRSLSILPVPTGRARPYGITIAPDGRVWVALFGTAKLAVVDPDSMILTEIDLPRDETRPRRLEVTSDGRVWYGDYEAGMLGVYDPADESFREYEMPSGANARPYAMAVDARDRIWFVETGVDPNYLVGFDPAVEQFVSITAIPSGGGVVRHMQYLEARNEIWFGTDMETIGRAELD
jgi:virginiamycin B lyase